MYDQMVLDEDGRGVDSGYRGEKEEAPARVERRPAVGDNPLEAYLGELRRHRRIKPDREIVLGRRIKRGRETMVALVLNSPVKLKAMRRLKADVVSWQEKGRAPGPTNAEMLALIRDRVIALVEKHPKNKELAKLKRRLVRMEFKIREAMDEMILANLRLVVKTAKRYMNRGMSLDDLIQEGNLGLIKAVGRYDYTTGFRFSTYAIWWIKQSITRAIYDKSRTVRLPVHLLEVRNAVYRAYYQLVGELGREPTSSEVAALLGLEPEKVANLTALGKDPVYLDAATGEDDVNLTDLILVGDTIPPWEPIHDRQVQQIVRTALDRLPRRERKVIYQRFGLETGEPLTLEQVGRQFNISRERVRQLENQALDRLRRGEHLPSLKNLF